MNGLYLVGFQRYTLKCAYRRDSYKLKHFAKFKTKNESIVMFSEVKLGLLGDLIASYIDAYSSTVLSAPDIPRMTGSLGLRSFIDSPICRSIDVGIQLTITPVSTLPLRVHLALPFRWNTTGAYSSHDS